MSEGGLTIDLSALRAVTARMQEPIEAGEVGSTSSSGEAPRSARFVRPAGQAARRPRESRWRRRAAHRQDEEESELELEQFAKVGDVAQLPLGGLEPVVKRGDAVRCQVVAERKSARREHNITVAVPRRDLTAIESVIRADPRGDGATPSRRSHRCRLLRAGSPARRPPDLAPVLGRLAVVDATELERDQPVERGDVVEVEAGRPSRRLLDESGEDQAEKQSARLQGALSMHLAQAAEPVADDLALGVLDPHRLLKADHRVNVRIEVKPAVDGEEILDPIESFVQALAPHGK
jgi:hypothetical protein